MDRAPELGIAAVDLAGGAVVVDTPGVREIATGSVPIELLDDVYRDVAALAPGCRLGYPPLEPTPTRR